MLKKTWLAAAILAVATTGWGQLTAKIHGHVQDPLGVPIANAKIIIATDSNVQVYAFSTNATGDYTGDGIVPGTYTILLQQIQGNPAKASSPMPGKIPDVVDKQENKELRGGTDTQVDFDLTRKEYIDKLPPAAKKALEDAKIKNAALTKENAQIKNINLLITEARTARQAGNFDLATTLDQQATQQKPDQGLLWYELGASQEGAKKYDDATTSYKKALDLLQAEKSPNQAMIASIENDLGGVYANTGKADLALAAYDAAVKAQPTNTAMFYGNEAVVLFNAGQNAAAGTAAEKAIAADPTKPVPYYIKGQSLIQNATMDPKTQKIILPPGCADAYQKYLELAPNGTFSNDVRGILNSAGETNHSNSKKGKH